MTGNRDLEDLRNDNPTFGSCGSESAIPDADS